LARGHWTNKEGITKKIDPKSEAQKRMEARVRQIKQGLADLEGQA